ncbi:glycosyltransferase family 2 protein [Salinisphaera hydrothermalis]|uniref:glycosyltransferase family 2 protein n=1 Tax=Salinisphaera hydrothermalis TaxID=563188 RepID=UPI00334064C6
MKVSVATLVRGRHRHLVNLMHGLNEQQSPPDELVIAWMQPETDTRLPATRFPVRHIHVPGQALPLAAARNAAAAIAAHPGLIFLDVDCIPSRPLVDRYRRALASGPALYMGEVRYLPAGAVVFDPAGRLDGPRLDQRAVVHPARPAVPRGGIRHEPDHGQLWGLSFALHATDYFAAGGMDEGYIGYGGEETDYARRLAATGIPAYWVGNARAWHQHHAVYRPPLAHFDSIVANARRYRTIWGEWCMDYWLDLLAQDGFIDWQPDADELAVRRRPTTEDIRAARLGPEACFG